MSSAPLNDGRGPDGLWPKSDYEKMGMGKSNLFAVYTMGNFIFGAPGIALAIVAIFFGPSAAVEKKMGIITSYNLAPLYLISSVVSLTFQLINANLGTARRPTRVNVPDQHVYRVYGGPADQSLVFMHDEDDFGKFNRAQRALANFEEVLPMLIMHLFLLGFVFPWTALTCTVIMCLGRVKGAVDYTTERMKRMTGNMSSMIILSSIMTANAVIGVAGVLLQPQAAAAASPLP